MRAKTEASLYCGLLLRQAARTKRAMSGNSRQVESIQSATHARLHETVLRHLSEPYRRVPSDRGRRAFDAIANRIAEAPFMLDAGCGTGASTFALALQFPERLVLGVDKSEARLAIGQRRLMQGDAPANALLLHCELVDFWQLAQEAKLRCERQFMLYPNPWPKPAQMKRRWHAHPVFPALLALSCNIELRTNWRIYAEEFAEASRLAGISMTLSEFHPTNPLTPFERKYASSGHRLWRGVT